MFEHFTFGAQSQSCYTVVEDSFPSPTDCSFTLSRPFPRTTLDEVLDGDEGLEEDEEEAKEEMQDIVSQLSTHSLHPSDVEHEQSSLSIWDNSNTLPAFDFSNETTDFTPEELTYTSSSRGKIQHSPSLLNVSSISNTKNGSVANRRLQRQLNTQLLSCTSHIKDISSLVSSMISTSSQCVLHPPPPLDIDDSPSSPLSPSSPAFQQLQQQTEIHEDEGFSELPEEEVDEMTLSLRRASTPSGIRKWNVRFRANGDVVNGPKEMAWVGRRKVKSVPRMRRRKRVEGVE